MPRMAQKADGALQRQPIAVTEEKISRSVTCPCSHAIRGFGVMLLLAGSLPKRFAAVSGRLRVHPTPSGHEAAPAAVV